MTAGGNVARVVGHSVWQRRRDGRGVLFDVWVGARSLEVGWHHLGVHGIPLGRGVVSVFVVITSAKV